MGETIMAEKYKVGEAPWDKKPSAPVAASNTYKVGEAPWDKKNEKPAEPKTRSAELNDFIPNMDTPEALVTGFNDGAYLGYGANATAAMTNPANYVETRDAVQKRYNELENTNTLGRAFGKTVGGIIPTVALPFTKMAQGMKYLPQMMGLAADGAVTGLAMNPGNTEGQVDGAQLSERLSNANFGGLMGPVIGTGVKAATSLPQIGQFMKDKAAKMSYLSSSPKLADRRVDAKTGMDKEMGRYMLDNGYNKPFGSTASVAEMSNERLPQVGQQLDDLYLRAQEQFKNASNRPGYDPIRDKAEMMRAAEQALVGVEGKEAALVRYGKYLDQMAAEHGDAPNQAAIAQYNKQMTEYQPKYENFVEQKRQYMNQVGKAGANPDQPVLDGMVDNLQRTTKKPITLETFGKEPSKAVAEPYETYTQGSLFEPNLPTRPENNAFNPGREVDDLLPLSQKITIDKNFQTAMQDVPYAPKFSAENNVSPAKPLQSEILGLQNTPRSYVEAEVPTVVTKRGQTKMVIAPEEPVRPTMPDEIRNPMSPRQMNNYKGDMDNVVNYNRNPLLKEPPAVEKAFYSGRDLMSKKIDDSIEQLSGVEGLSGLKKANKSYQIESKIKKYSNDQTLRDDVNKPMSLTNTILAIKGIPYAIAKATGEKFGYQTGAAALDPLGNLLQMNEAQLLQGAGKYTPEASNLMLQRYLMMNNEGK